jgi:hypothetical protein
MTAGAPPMMRMRQGTRALSAFARSVDWERVQAVLSADELALFRRMRRSEQLHSLNVLHEVYSGQSSALAQAALLHDVGKIRYPIRLWQRMMPVLVGAVSPASLQRLSERDPRPMWSRGFVVAAHHPEWGAQMLAAVGAPDDVVWLVRHHADDPTQWTDHPFYPLLVQLQAADDRN